MELITWFDKYSIGNEELDNQHKVLFDLINELYQSCNDKKVALDLFEKIMLCANSHVTKEGQYMEDIGYKDIEEHIYFNEALKQKMVALKQSINNEKVEDAKEVVAYLAFSILNHVMTEDKKISKPIA